MDLHLSNNASYQYSRTSIVDPPNKGKNRNNLSIKDTSESPKCSLPIVLIRTTSFKRTKCLVSLVLYSEVPL